MKKNTIVEIIAALLVFLFIYAALSKLLDLDKFKYQLGQSPFITNISWFAAWAIPLGEILVSVALLIRRTRLAGLYLSFFLMLLFTGYIFMMLRYSSYLPCSCGGVLSVMSWKQHFVFNLIFTGLSLLGIAIENTRTNKVIAAMQ
ncbi:MAG: DoxX family membrane protein [Chitinophagaceae bacterium]|nr:DoxX family membrane protein [Chitinophagaceae bacterium]